MEIYVTISLFDIECEYGCTKDKICYAGTNKEKAFNTDFLQGGKSGLIVEIWCNDIKKEVLYFNIDSDKWEIV